MKRECKIIDQHASKQRRSKKKHPKPLCVQTEVTTTTDVTGHLSKIKP